MTVETPDVLVVGLGPAGSRAAEAAARAGLSVIALEKRGEPGSPVQCAEFVPSMIERDVPAVGEATAQMVERMLTFVEDDEHAEETPEFRGRMIDRGKFDRMLAQNAADAGADCRYGVKVLAIDGDGTVHVSGGDSFKPKVLIGADGPRSRVGAAIGSVNRDLVEARQIALPLVLPHDATDIFLSADYRGGYGWLFPKGAVANVGLGVVVDGALEDGKSTRRGLKEMLLALVQRLAHARRIGTNGWALTGGAIPVGGRLKSIGGRAAAAARSARLLRRRRQAGCPRADRRLDRLAALLAARAAGGTESRENESRGEDAMSCLEGPRQAVPDFLSGVERVFNDAETMQPRAPGAIPRDARNGGRVKTQDVKPEGFYRPNYNILTPNMRSPDYVQMSTAAAITLGVMSGYMHRTSCTRCLNLLLTYPEGCRANCAYCGLARHREAERNYADRNFIRVDWPAVPYDKVIDIVANGGDGGRFHRMCISMITHPRSDDDTRVVLRKWTERIKHVPVSILSNPTTMTRLDVQELHDLGADIFTVALDACNRDVFDRTRGRGVQSPHSWDKYW
ncbi:MAG: FAD-dependent monooxygenase, partial [Pseudolabrys sp.]